MSELIIPEVLPPEGFNPFEMVYPDPNWGYNQRCKGSADTRFGGGASGEYEVVKNDGLIAMAHQFKAMRPRRGVMLMWVTNPFGEFSYQLMRAYGYHPIKILWFWIKTYPKGKPAGGKFFEGSGAYTASNVEWVLMGQASLTNRLMPINRLAVGGNGISVPEVIEAPDETDYEAAMWAAHLEAQEEAIESPHPRGRRDKIIHSKKPRIFYHKAIELFGDVPRVEVFAREQYAGWHAIGDQLPGGERIEPGRIIRPLAPPPVDIAHRVHKSGVQPGLFGALPEVSA